MNKKVIITISLLALCIQGMVYAQDTTKDLDNYLEPGQVKTVIQDISSDNLQSLQNIQARFCNDEKNLTRDITLEMRPGQRKEICIVVNNLSQESVWLVWWFTQANKNDVDVLVCGWDMSTTNDFAKAISPRPTSEITIPAGGSTIHRFIYTAPHNATGDQAGCFGYQMQQQEEREPGAMFAVIPRKVGYINIHISGERYPFWRVNNLATLYTNHKQIILKTIIAILSVWLFITIIKTIKQSTKDKKSPKKQ